MRQVQQACNVFCGTVKSINDTNIGGVGCTVVLDDETVVRLTPTDLTRLRGLINVGTSVIVYKDVDTDAILYLTVYPKAIRSRMFNWIDSDQVEINLGFQSNNGSPVSNFFNRWITMLK